MLPRFPSDRGRQAPRAALPLLLALLLMPSGFAGQFSGELVIEEWTNLDYNSRDGSMTLQDVLITHGADTRITAKRAHRTERPSRVNQLDLSGGVHIQFRDATLDADSAQMIFRGDELQSVHVKGTQARFSHQPRGYPRRIDGQADAIDFNASSGEVRFSGNTAYTDGRYSLSDRNVVTYSINEGTVRDDGDRSTRGRAVIRLDTSDERVPAPLPPERSTAE